MAIKNLSNLKPIYKLRAIFLEGFFLVRKIFCLNIMHNPFYSLESLEIKTLSCIIKHFQVMYGYRLFEIMIMWLDTTSDTCILLKRL